jgi:hypothetical protein
MDRLRSGERINGRGGLVSGKLNAHVRGNVVGYVALFVALSGTAWAVSDLSRNEVKSRHIGKGQVKRSDLRANSVTSPKVANGSLLGEDLAAGLLPEADTPQEVLDKVKQVDGSGSGLDADTVGGIPASQLGGVGRQAIDPDGCHDNGLALFENCATVQLDLPRAGRVLLGASGYAYAEALDGPGTDDANSVWGGCALAVDGTEVGQAVQMSMYNPLDRDPVAMTAVSEPLPAGAHTFAARCTTVDGNIDWYDFTLSAVLIGDG